MMNILNGGKHADNTVDLQEFMIMPCGAGNFEDGIRMCVEIYQFLKILLRENGLSTAVGDEGGFAPDLKDSRDVLRLILEAVEKAGYEPGKDIFIAIDAAASELYDEEQGVYRFPGESKMKAEEVLRDAAEMIDYYEELLEEFPIISIEDGLNEDDWEGWKTMTERLGDRLQLVGDDLFVTNVKRLSCGIRLEAANVMPRQSKPDRYLKRGDGAVKGAARRIPCDHLTSFGRDRRCFYRRSCSGDRSRADQDRSTMPL